jgi:hypothetical protein
MADTPVRPHYLEASGGVDMDGVWARGEAGLQLLPNLNAFGYTQWRPKTGAEAGGGIRFSFGGP